MARPAGNRPPDRNSALRHFTFDDDDRLAGEKIYYDRATLLRQLGMFHDPDRAVGRVVTVLTHPLTMAQIVRRKIWRNT